MASWNDILNYRDIKSLIHSKELAEQTVRTQTSHRNVTRIKAEQTRHAQFLENKESISAAALRNHHNLGQFFNTVEKHETTKETQQEILLQQQLSRKARWDVQTDIVKDAAKSSFFKEQQQKERREENHQVLSPQSLFNPKLGG